LYFRTELGTAQAQQEVLDGSAEWQYLMSVLDVSAEWQYLMSGLDVSAEWQYLMAVLKGSTSGGSWGRPLQEAIAPEGVQWEGRGCDLTERKARAQQQIERCDVLLGSRAVYVGCGSCSALQLK
jgi:hypothetical protein